MTVVLSSIIIGFSWASTSLPFSLQWGSYGLQTTGQFAFPQGITVDSSGNVYVTDLGNRRIEKFDNNGNFLFTWGTKGSGNGQLQAPMGIAIGGNAIYIVDNELNKVHKFDMTGKFVTQWGSQGNDNGQFLLPQGIAVDPSGDVYVVDSGNNRIEKFTQDGVFLQAYGSSSGSNLKTPLGITVDKSGNIYVVDNGNNRIVELDKNGNTITSWGTQGKGPDFFDNPRDVVADSAGNVFVVDTNNNRIQKFGSQSLQTETQTQTQITNQTQATQTQTVNQAQQTNVPNITNPNDKTPPTITDPADMTVEATGILTSVSVGQATATDDSGIASITNNAPQKFPLGTTMVTWTALDNGGNVAKTIQKITVVDTTA